MKYIDFCFHKDGRIEIDAQGFQGQGCTDAARLLAEGLGPLVGERELKAEYYEQHQGEERQLN